MKKVMLIHGWKGSDLPHWQAWLAQELVIKNVAVAFVQLSNNDYPDKDIWTKEAYESINDFKPDTVICHSLGNALWFHLCQLNILEVQNLLLVAPTRDLGDFEELKTFFPVTIPSSLKSKKSLMITSDNDPYLSVDEARMLQKQLQIEHIELHDAGHINSDSNYGQWNWVLDWTLNL